MRSPPNLSLVVSMPMHGLLMWMVAMCAMRESWIELCLDPRLYHVERASYDPSHASCACSRDYLQSEPNVLVVYPCFC